MLPNVLISIAAVALQYLQQLLHPFLALLAVGAQQRMHGKHVHLVVMGGVSLTGHPVAQILVINDVIAAGQARQIEGFGGGIHRHRVLSCPVVHHQGGGVLMTGVHNIRPDFIADYQTLILFKHLHGLFQLPALPHTARRVVGRAEDGQMDLVLPQLPVHVLIVHPPYSLRILHKGAVHRHPPQHIHIRLEAHIDRAVQKNSVAGGGQGLHRAGHAAVHPVFIADVFLFQIGEAVAAGPPAYDFGKVFLPGLKIAVQRMLCPPDDGLRHRRAGGKVHVRHPHGNGIKALRRGLRLTAPVFLADALDGGCIKAPPVDDGGKIVFHCTRLLFRAKGARFQANTSRLRRTSSA